MRIKPDNIEQGAWPLYSLHSAMFNVIRPPLIIELDCPNSIECPALIWNNPFLAKDPVISMAFSADIEFAFIEKRSTTLLNGERQKSDNFQISRPILRSLSVKNTSSLIMDIPEGSPSNSKTHSLENLDFCLLVSDMDSQEILH